MQDNTATMTMCFAIGMDTKSPELLTQGLFCFAALFAFAPSIHEMYYFHFAYASNLGKFT